MIGHLIHDSVGLADGAGIGSDGGGSGAVSGSDGSCDSAAIRGLATVCGSATAAETAGAARNAAPDAETATSGVGSAGLEGLEAAAEAAAEPFFAADCASCAAAAARAAFCRAFFAFLRDGAGDFVVRASSSCDAPHLGRDLEGTRLMQKKSVDHTAVHAERVCQE